MSCTCVACESSSALHQILVLRMCLSWSFVNVLLLFDCLVILPRARVGAEVVLCILICMSLAQLLEINIIVMASYTACLLFPTFVVNTKSPV